MAEITSPGRVLRLCAAYFGSYVLTGVAVKLFVGKHALVLPVMRDMEYLAYSTLGGTLLCLGVALAGGWHRMRSARPVRWLGREWPSELKYIVPSGLCTALVIPTTTIMYTLPISVMVAMVIMRGSVIVISRVVDAVQLRQGLVQRRVAPEENWAVGFAIAAVSVHLLFASPTDGFAFLDSPLAVVTLGSYVVAYAARIYIMNYYKNTRPTGVPQDNRGFFALEQISASAFMLVLTLAAFTAGGATGATGAAQLASWHDAVANPHPDWLWAVSAGLVYGLVAFFSVFIFMLPGRSATFSGLVNRLTSLLAGTAATLLSALLLGAKMPGATDWSSLGLVLIAVGFLSVAERRRALAPRVAPAGA